MLPIADALLPALACPVHVPAIHVGLPHLRVRREGPIEVRERLIDSAELMSRHPAIVQRDPRVIRRAVQPLDPVRVADQRQQRDQPDQQRDPLRRRGAAAARAHVQQQQRQPAQEEAGRRRRTHAPRPDRGGGVGRLGGQQLVDPQIPPRDVLGQCQPADEHRERRDPARDPRYACAAPLLKCEDQQCRPQEHQADGRVRLHRHGSGERRLQRLGAQHPSEEHDQPHGRDEPAADSRGRPAGADDGLIQLHVVAHEVRLRGCGSVCRHGSRRRSRQALNVGRHHKGWSERGRGGMRCCASKRGSAGRGAARFQEETGELGFEPRQADPESAVLPLHHSPLGLTYSNCSIPPRQDVHRLRQ